VRRALAAQARSAHLHIDALRTRETSHNCCATPEPTNGRSCTAPGAVVWRSVSHGICPQCPQRAFAQREAETAHRTNRPSEAATAPRPAASSPPDTQTTADRRQNRSEGVGNRKRDGSSRRDMDRELEPPPIRGGRVRPPARLVPRVLARKPVLTRPAGGGKHRGALAAFQPSPARHEPTRRGRTS
jgi:hypothetical protein